MNYNNFCQAKILDFSIASLGSLMETLHINEDSHIKQNDKRRLYDKEGREVEIGELLLHDSDSKAFIRGTNGKIFYQDLIKSKLVEEYVRMKICRIQVQRKALSVSVLSTKWQTLLRSRPSKQSQKTPFTRSTQEPSKALEVSKNTQAILNSHPSMQQAMVLL